MSKQSFTYISSKILKLIFRTVQITVVLGLLLFVLAFWRLSVSPVNIDFLMPKLTSIFVPEESGLKLHIDSMILKTGFQKEGLAHIHIDGLTLLRKDGTIVADIPEITMSYGLWNIITLNYLPDTMKIRRPVFQAVIDEQGQFFIRNQADGNSEKNTKSKKASDIPMVLNSEVPIHLVLPESETVLKTLEDDQTEGTTSDEVKEKTSDSALKQIKIQEAEAIIRYFLKFERLEIENAALLLDDRYLNRSFSISDIYLLLEWPEVYEHTLRGGGTIQSEGGATKVSLKLSLNRQTKQVPFDVTIDALEVSKFGTFLPILEQNTLTVGARIFGQFDFSKGRHDIRRAVTDLAFEINTKKEGNIRLPSPLTNTYHIQKAMIKGRFSPDLSALTLKDSFVSLKDGGYADVTAQVSGLGRFLDTFDPSLLSTRLQAHVTGLAVDQTSSVWPSELGPDAHAWVKKNIFNGNISKADFTLYFKGLDLIDLFGRIFVEGASVRYVQEMPVVHGVSGEVLLYPDKVEIFATQGQIENLKLKKASLFFTKLKSETPHAKIELNAMGPLKEALGIISSKPLEFPQMFGLNVEKTDGMGDVSLKLDFPLTDRLNLSQIQVDVDADLTQTVFPLPVGNERLTNGTFKLVVNNNSLVLQGDAHLRSVPLSLKWQEFFKDSQKDQIQSVYDISSDVHTDTLKKWIPEIGEYADGRAPFRARIQKKFTGQYMFNIDTDLKDIKLILYPIASVKEKGKEATLKLNGTIQPKGSPAFDFSFSALKGEISAVGSVSLQDGFSVTLGQLTAPGTQIKGTFQIDSNKNMILRAGGRSWNLTQLFDLPFLKNDSAEKQDQQLKESDKFKSILLDIRLNSVLLKKGKPLKNVEIKGTKKGMQWQNLFVFASALKPFTVHYAPEKRLLRIQTDDTGDLLNRLNITDRFTNGRLNVEAKQGSLGVFSGTVNIKDFQFKDPGFFVQAVTILGIVDGIVGNELNFKKAKIPFDINSSSVITVNNGYAYGTTLGVTFGGSLDQGRLNVTGSVIPAYVVNSLLGRIPLIGGLFKDGDGGGLVGVKYTVGGKLFSPKIQFHPLASMAPGMLGTLFR